MSLRKYILENKNSKYIDKWKNNLNFKRWFGNSKVVNTKNEPMVVYHGSTSEIEFDSFDGDRGLAWFTDNIDYAEIYTRDEGILMKCFLSIQNPFKIEQDLSTVVSKSVAEDILDIQISKSNLHRSDREQFLYEWIDETSSDFLEIIESNGYDGVQAIEYGHNSWLIFDQTQAKHVKNKGTFNNNDGNIFK